MLTLLVLDAQRMEPSKAEPQIRDPNRGDPNRGDARRVGEPQRGDPLSPEGDQASAERRAWARRELLKWFLGETPPLPRPLCEAPSFEEANSDLGNLGNARETREAREGGDIFGDPIDRDALQWGEAGRSRGRTQVREYEGRGGGQER